MEKNTPTAKVVIIGGGFAGIKAAQELRNAPVSITLIDRNNHHLFQPLLYQVATASLSTAEIAQPIRHILRDQKNARVVLGEVSSVDAKGKVVKLFDGGEFEFDYLIVAAGATHGYFGRDEWAEFAPGLKSLNDAVAIRRRLLLSFEKAERTTDEAERAALLTVAIVGAGPTGVEMSGAISEIARHTLRGEFRSFDPATTRVVLLEGAPRVLGVYDPSLSEKARIQLENLGVEVVLGAKVTDVDKDGLWYELDGKRIRLESRNKIWAAGVAASPLGKALAEATGAATDRAGRVIVDADLSVPGHSNIFVVGDLSSAKSYGEGDPKPVPGVSPAAIQGGTLAAKNIIKLINGKPTDKFVYWSKGDMATIGRAAAVASVPFIGGKRIKLSGFPAWILWLFVHIFFLVGFTNRVMVFISWVWSYCTLKRRARIVTKNS